MIDVVQGFYRGEKPRLFCPNNTFFLISNDFETLSIGYLLTIGHIFSFNEMGKEISGGIF